jgi:hypothetical protein
MQYVVLQVILKEKLWGTGSGNLTSLEKAINDQAAKGFRLHTITTASSGSKGLGGAATAFRRRWCSRAWGDGTRHETSFGVCTGSRGHDELDALKDRSWAAVFTLIAARMHLIRLGDRLHGQGPEPAVRGLTVDRCLTHFHNHLDLRAVLPTGCI